MNIVNVSAFATIFRIRIIVGCFIRKKQFSNEKRNEKKLD